MSIEIPDCLKRVPDICVKTVIPSKNTAFRCSPPAHRAQSPPCWMPSERNSPQTKTTSAEEV